MEIATRIYNDIYYVRIGRLMWSGAAGGGKDLLQDQILILTGQLCSKSLDNGLQRKHERTRRVPDSLSNPKLSMVPVW